MSRANEPAAPVAPVYYSHGRVLCGGSDGMTIREQIAIVALHGLLAGDSTVPHTAAAQQSCLYADALLAELAKEPSA